MASELRKQRADAQNQVTELASDVKGILAAITGPAVGGDNAAPTRSPVRPVYEGHPLYPPHPQSSCWACGQLGHFSHDCPGAGPPRRRAVVVEAGALRLAVDAKPPSPLPLRRQIKPHAESLPAGRDPGHDPNDSVRYRVKSACYLLSSFALEPSSRPVTFQPTTVVCW